MWAEKLEENKVSELPILKANDKVEIIAPASRVSEKRLTELIDLLTSWQLQCIVSKDIFGDDLLCANSDDMRFNSLKNAFNNPETKAIFCVRGGYGCMRLIPELAKISPPKYLKLFIGMSDITALHLYLLEHWQWPVLHGALAIDKFSEESILASRSILFGDKVFTEIRGTPLNEKATENLNIETTITGGNLCLVQASIGTLWQINSYNKIIFLEDVSERGYRVDRMLEHLKQAGLFENAKAICFGDFMDGFEPNGSSLVDPVLKRFAENCDIPVVKIEGIGHGRTNYPLPLGTKASLQLGNTITFISYR